MTPYHFINLHQTIEERKSKYWLARSLGYNSYWARDMRDWRLSKIERMANLQPVTLVDEQINQLTEF